MSNQAVVLREWIFLALQDAAHSLTNEAAETSLLSPPEPWKLSFHQRFKPDTPGFQNGKKKPSPSSELYLNAALCVAISLTSILCKYNEKKNLTFEGKNNSLSNQLEYCQWTDSITVTCSHAISTTKKINYLNVQGVEIGNIPFLLCSEIRNDTKGAVKSNVQMSRDYNGTTFEKDCKLSRNDNKSYSRSDGNSDGNSDDKEARISFPKRRKNIEKENIHLLGLIFYQIFSGGKIPFDGDSCSKEDDVILDSFGASLKGNDISTDYFPSFFENDRFATKKQCSPPLALPEQHQKIISELNDNQQLSNEDFMQDQSVKMLCDGNILPIRDKMNETALPISKKQKNHLKFLHKNDRQLSLEPLKELDVPVSICDMIENMIHSNNQSGDADDTVITPYQYLAEVRETLELMVSHPDQYLRNIDIISLSKYGLPVNDKLYGRGYELNCLFDSYQRSSSSNRNGKEVTMISGPSGVGKSKLAKQVISSLSQHKGLKNSVIGLFGKFDELSHRQKGNSFSAIASAFDGYCQYLLDDAKKSSYPLINIVSPKLKNVLGTEAQCLARLIPKLNAVLGHASLNVTYRDKQAGDAVNATKLIQFLFCQFLQVIFSFSNIILCLDDLQWADASAIELIRQLLINFGSGRGAHLSFAKSSMNSDDALSKNFFFLGCYRDDEIDQNHPLSKMISSLGNFRVIVTTVRLDCLSVEGINLMISDILQRSPHVTRPLAKVLHRKTQGNPLFLVNMLKSLSEERSLRLNFSRNRWEWNLSEINLRSIPKDIVGFLMKNINQLPDDVQNAICVASCFGSCFKYADILEKSLDHKLVIPLNYAVEKGLMNKNGDVFQFAHDRIQQAGYNKINPEDRGLFHSKYGLLLSDNDIIENDDEVLFDATSQINQGGPCCVIDINDRLKIARLNLSAGSKAVSRSEFSLALSFFDNGISYLRKNHWVDHYDLTLALYNGAAKCCLAVGDLSLLEILSEQVCKYANCFEDKITVIIATVQTLISTGNPRLAITTTLGALRQLNEEFPISSTTGEVQTCLFETKVLIGKLSDSQLLNYRMMTDPTKIITMKLLAIISLPAIFVMPGMLPIVVAKMMLISLSHGMSPVSPIGFVHYSRICLAADEIDEGYRFAKLSIRLLDNVDRNFEPEVLHLAAEVLFYKEPIQSLTEILHRGYNAGMHSGNVAFAIMNLFLRNACAYWSGANLPQVKVSFEIAMHIARQHDIQALYAVMSYLYYCIINLIGTIDDADYSTTAVEEDPGKFTVTSVSTSRQKMYYFKKMFLAFVFHHFDDTKKFLKKFFDIEKENKYAPLSHALRLFYSGLISFWVGRRSNDKSMAERGNNILPVLESWAKACPWNFQSKLYILMAEKHYFYRDYESAKPFYDSAIKSAKTHRFLNEEALFCELAGNFHLETGRKDEASDYFKRALASYRAWGAFKKARFLEAFLRTSGINMTTGGPFDLLTLDVNSLIQNNVPPDQL